MNAAPLPYARVPGPRGWPLLGVAAQVRRERFHLQLEEWARMHGGRAAFRIGPRRFLAITRPEAIAAVLRDRPLGFGRSRRLEEASRASGFGGLFSANGEHWRRQRPMVLRGLDPAHIREFFPSLIEITQRLQRRWQAAARAGTGIDLQADLMRFTVDVTTVLALGEDINTIEQPEGETLQTHLNQILPALFRQVLTPFAFLGALRWRERRRIEGHMDALRIEVDRLIAKARDEIVRDPRLKEQPRNLLQAMVAERDRGTGGLTDADVAGNALTMLLAGEDTTANTLAWLVWLLHRHPQACARARTEVREVLGAKPCPQDTDDLAKLHYLEACAQEAMRLRPVAPLIMSEALADAVVDGVQVPRGTMVVALIRPPGLDAIRFPQPEAFRPERWLEDAVAPAGGGSSRRVSMPFGAGPRMCPGRYLALAEIKMVAAMLLANFRIEDVSTADGGEPQERIALTMYPVGLRMRLAP